ncbi:hypothetical protein Tco_0693875 [Tanacetum coccineum]
MRQGGVVPNEVSSVGLTARVYAPRCPQRKKMMAIRAVIDVYESVVGGVDGFSSDFVAAHYLETTMMSKKMAELEDDFREFKAHTERNHHRLCNLLDQLQLRYLQNAGDFGCLSPNNMTDFEEDEKEFENTRSVPKEDKDEQGKEEKGVVKFFEVGTDEENNLDIVLNDVGGIVYGKGNDTMADARLKHGSYFLLDRISEDGWYFHDESRLSKEPLLDLT